MISEFSDTGPGLPVLERIPESLRHLPAISIHQPWANSIIFGGKDIENRSRRTFYRGQILIHASMGMDQKKDVDRFHHLISSRMIPAKWADGIDLWGLPRGGIIGVAEIVACVSTSKSPWFLGKWGYVLQKPEPLPFTPCRGALGLFYPLAKPAL